MSTTDKASTDTSAAADPTDAAAGAQLSTAPLEDGPSGPAVGIGVIGWARWFWRQLTSMRVALILLFLLSLGAIPGSLVPQTSVDAMKVTQWKRDHASWVGVAEKLQLFDVYSSVWFSAIYLLLFISLIGCIVPRSWQFVGQLRGRPPGAPRRLDRLPAHTTWRTGKTPDEVLSYARTVLRGSRFRTEPGKDHVAAEKGYLREAGNLIFHVALIVMLVAFAWGQYFKSEGGKLVLRGSGFSNTLTQYDDFKSGALFDPDDLPPFSFTLDRFDASYEMTGPQRGTPRDFKAYVTFTDGAHGTPQKREIQVNKPMEVDGSKVYLLGHGYAPIVSVTDPTGKVIFKDAVPVLPQDANLTSTGAVKVTDGYKDKDGKQEQLGFSAVFVPSFAGEGMGTMFLPVPRPPEPAAHAQRLARQPRRGLGSAAERLPARQLQDGDVQGRVGPAVQAETGARRHDDPAERRGHREVRGHRAVGHLLRHPPARQRPRPRGRDRRHRRPRRIAVHPAPPDLGPRRDREGRRDRRRDGGPGPQRVHPAPAGAGGARRRAAPAGPECVSRICRNTC